MQLIFGHNCYGRKKPVLRDKPVEPPQIPANEIRDAISTDFDVLPCCDTDEPDEVDDWPDLDFYSNLDSTQSSFALHPISDLDPEILQSLYDELIDVGALLQLQECGAINAYPAGPRAEWDPSSSKLTVAGGNRDGPFAALLPVRVAGDGNCLLHSVSRALWGVHDRPLPAGTAPLLAAAGIILCCSGPPPVSPG